MPGELQIVRCELEPIIWIVIVVATVIAQIIKAGKKAARTRKPPPNTTPRPTQRPTRLQEPEGRGTEPSPNDELRSFLESLTGGSMPQAPAAATPRPLAPPSRPMAAQHRPAEPRRVAVRVPPPVPSKSPPRPPSQPAAEPRVAPAPQPQMVAVQASSREGAYSIEIGDTVGRVARDYLVSQLRAPGSLRKAVLLREILGPPHALAPPGNYQ